MGNGQIINYGITNQTAVYGLLSVIMIEIIMINLNFWFSKTDRSLIMIKTKIIQIAYITLKVINLKNFLTL